MHVEPYQPCFARGFKPSGRPIGQQVELSIAILKIFQWKPIFLQVCLLMYIIFIRQEVFKNSNASFLNCATWQLSINRTIFCTMSQDYRYYSSS